MIRWRIAILVAVAIVINYLDRLTLPTALDDIRAQSGLTFDAQQRAFMNTAFLAAYGTMYLAGGKLMDFLGTRLGFALIMIFWSLACASHGFANSLIMLAVCRVLLGFGEGGGFPAATRAVAEWFPVKERSTAMGIINGGTGIGGIIALPLVLLVVKYVHWFNLESWRWVFFLTGSLGIVWLLWWLWDYHAPEKHPAVTEAEREQIRAGMPAAKTSEPAIPMATLFQYRETWGIVFAKFLTDAAWYFILFWLPPFLRNPPYSLNINTAMSVAWIPHAAAFIGCLIGGSLSSWLLRRNMTLNAARKIALFGSAIVMPLLILVPYVSLPWVIALFAVGYFGQQSWSTLVMVLPTDLYPKRAVGTVAGMVGLGGALGGIVLGQLAGYLYEHGADHRHIMLMVGLLHVSGFGVIALTVRNIKPLPIPTNPGTRHQQAVDRFALGLKLQIPANLLLLLGLVVVLRAVGPFGYAMMIMGAVASLIMFVSFIFPVRQNRFVRAWAILTVVLTLLTLAWKILVLSDPARWQPHEFFAACCISLSAVADLILLLIAILAIGTRRGTTDHQTQTPLEAST